MLESEQRYVDAEGLKVLAEAIGDKINSIPRMKQETVVGEAGKTIQEVVTSPEADTLYFYKAGAEATTYSMHVCDVTKDASGNPVYNWKSLGDTDVDLSAYYSKDDLKPLEADEIRSIVNAAM